MLVIGGTLLKSVGLKAHVSTGEEQVRFTLRRAYFLKSVLSTTLFKSIDFVLADFLE